jgi:hypothetical protein
VKSSGEIQGTLRWLVRKVIGPDAIPIMVWCERPTQVDPATGRPESETGGAGARQREEWGDDGRVKVSRSAGNGGMWHVDVMVGEHGDGD